MTRTVLLLACLLGSTSVLAEPAVKVMVLPLKPGPGVGKNSAEVLTGAFVTSLQSLQGLQVLTMKDVDDLLGFERKKAAVNVEVSKRLGEDVCTGDTSCLAEIGGALGTQFIVTGSIDKLGSLTALTVQVLDSRKATVIERHQERVKGGEEVLIERMDVAAQALFPGRGGAGTPVPATGGLSFGGGVQVKRPTVKIAAATGGTFKDINLEVEQLLDAALVKQDDPKARAEEKAGAWCALAAISDRNPYEQQASQACEEWRKYADASRGLEEQLEGDYRTLAGFVGLKRKSKQDKLAAVDAFLATYGALSEHLKVDAVKAARKNVALGREVSLPVESEEPPVAAQATPTSGDVMKRAFGPCPDQVSCLMQNECKKGKAVSCSNLAGLYAQGQGVPKDTGRALALMEFACNAGHLASCANLGVTYLYTEEVKSPERAMPFLRRACDGRNAAVCASIGIMFMLGNGVPKDIKRAFDELVRACDYDDTGLHCHAPAAWLLNGFETIARDAERAEAMYRKACNGKQQGGCDMLELVEKQKQEQRELEGKTERQLATLSREFEDAERACERHNICKYQLESCRSDRKNCHSLASIYVSGIFDQPKNEAIAAEWNRRACEAGSEYGCHSYATAMLEGKGVKRDERGALEHFRRLCGRSGGDPTMVALACWSLSHYGTADDKVTAKKRHEQLCDQKNKTACIYIGR